MSGNYAELLFATQATRRGLMVSFPFSDSLTYDCIIDDGGKLLKVQVKGSANYDRGALSFKIQRGVTYNRKQRLYEAGDFDILALVDISSESIYIFRADEVRSVVKIRSNGKYGKRKNDWSIFGAADRDTDGTKTKTRKAA